MGLLRRSAVWLALAGIGGAACALAVLTRRADTACLRGAAAERATSAVVEEDAKPGTFVRATLVGPRCRVPMRIDVAAGSAPEGAAVRVTGSAVVAGPRIVVQDATIRLAAPPPLARRIRSAVRRAIDRTFGNDAPMVRALVIAETGGIEPSIRDRFADAGIVHLLSVSGLHVAIIAGAAELVFTALRLARRPAQLASLALTAGYVVVIGMPAPAVRSAVMLGVVVLTRVLQRPTSPWACLALGALIPLADPHTMTDLGYQLSVAGIAGLIASGALARRLLAPRLSGWRLLLARDLTVSVVASLVTLPLVSWTFGRVSLVAPATNLVAGPIFTLLQPTLFLGILLSPVPAAAAVVADATHGLLALTDAIVGIAVRVPFATIAVAPTLVAAVALATVSCGIVVACVSRDWARWLAVALGAAALGVWAPSTLGGSGVELHMIDVGQGDALALRTPRGRWVVFDAGRSWRGGDAGRATVVPYIRRRGGEVAAFVLSHPHADHAGGAATLLHATHPGAFWDAGYVAAIEPYRAALVEASRDRVPWRRVHPGEVTAIDGVRITFLAPDSAWAAGLDDPNAASTIALVRYGDVRFLLVGDAEASEESWLIAHAADELHADVLKVGHHGSRTSSTAAFLDAVRPRVALISVGAGNTYGHPSAEVVHELRRRGAAVMRTDEVGTTVVRTDGRALSVETGGGEARWIVRGASPAAWPGR
jgi:competence protein ComEC